MKHSLSALAALLALTVSAQGSEAASLAFDPVPEQTVGDSFTVNLRAFDLPVLTLGGSLNLRFDEDVLRLEGVSVNSTAWEFDTRPGTIDNDRGELDFLSFSSFAGRSGNVDIATLTFTAIGSGQSRLDLNGNSRNPFTLDDASTFSPTLVDSSVTVQASPVPLPAAAWLLGSGIAALVFPVRRRAA